jgi:pimeloyl-ACP methyl ester carboxylesterase
MGVSYGTFLGATYANLFPGKVKAMIVDGNIDPVAWTHSQRDLSTFLRQGSDIGSATALKGFLDRCGRATAARCAFAAGSPAGTHAKLNTLFERLRKHPVTIGSPAQAITYATAVNTLVGSLYTTEPSAVAPGWSASAKLLQQLWEATTPGHATAEPHTAASSVPSEDGYNGEEQGLGVACSESPNPRDPKTHRDLAVLAASRSGDVGRRWAWLAAPCASWPGTDRDRYAGPWNRRTEHPILVIGTKGDPATPYKSSVAMSRDLADARLLTVDGYGHTALLNKSSCADAIETRYLLTGALPPAGTVCRPDHEPFTA